MNRILLICSILLALVLQSCWIGDQDDPEILYEPTVIELLCQNPDLSTFCELVYLTPVIPEGTVGGGSGIGRVPEAVWKLSFSGRGPIRNGQACPSDVETVFAPDNEAWETYLAANPQWPTIYDIPKDTVSLLVRHHIFNQGKLLLPSAAPECTAVDIIGGSTGYNMWVGRWAFATNPAGDFFGISLLSFVTTQPIISPDLSSTDGAVYIVNTVVPPF